MYSRVLGLLLCLMFFPAEVPSVLAGDVLSVNYLIENARELNGKNVVLQGEVIGPALSRGEFTWLNINDGKMTVGVWINTRQCRALTYRGGYGCKGDIVLISGVFNRACAEHGADLDVHAASLEIVKPGELTDHHVSFGKKLTAAILLLCALISVILIGKKGKDHERKNKVL